MTDTPTFSSTRNHTAFFNLFFKDYCDPRDPSFTGSYSHAARHAEALGQDAPNKLYAAIRLSEHLRAGGAADPQMQADWAQIQAACARASGAHGVYENTALSGELRDHALDEYCETVDAIHADLVAMFDRMSGGAA